MGEPSVDRALVRARQAEDRATLWSALEPLRGELGRDREVAAVWAEALRTSPMRATLVEEARVALEAWPGDAMLVAALSDALLRAERRPIDEPPLGEGPASIAAGATDRCFARLGPVERADPEVGGVLLALRGNALRALGEKRHADSIAALERAIALDPDRGEWHYDLGLTFKHARDFSRTLEACRRARAILGDIRPVLFNLAIAATALGEGTEAAEAWRALGMDAHVEGARAVVPGLPPVQLRLPTIGAGHLLDRSVPDEAAGFELVWAAPLSPCHGVIRSPTFRDALADFGDLVLWDAAPVTVREHEGAAVPCFPLLGVLGRGGQRRYRFLALQQRATDVAALAEALPDEVIVYPHGERVERVCPRCAAGELLSKHDHLPAEEHRVAFGKVVVPVSLDLAALARALDEARRAVPGILLAIPGLYEDLGDSAQAGKHHKRWGEIERARARP